VVWFVIDSELYLLYFRENSTLIRYTLLGLFFLGSRAQIFDDLWHLERAKFCPQKHFFLFGIFLFQIAAYVQLGAFLNRQFGYVQVKLNYEK
jgi:hypothetical protein